MRVRAGGRRTNTRQPTDGRIRTGRDVEFPIPPFPWQNAEAVVFSCADSRVYRRAASVLGVKYRERPCQRRSAPTATLISRRGQKHRTGTCTRPPPPNSPPPHPTRLFPAGACSISSTAHAKTTASSGSAPRRGRQDLARHELSEYPQAAGAVVPGGCRRRRHRLVLLLYGSGREAGRTPPQETVAVADARVPG